MRLSYLSYCLKSAVVFLTIALILVVAGLPVVAAGNAIVSVSVPSQPVSAGSQFVVSVVVQPNNAIAGVQIQLSFNPSLVTINSITEGNLLKQNGANTYFSPGQINNSAGIVTGIAGAIISPGQTVSTQGTFVTVTMTAGSNKGIGSLTLSNVIVGDINGQSVPISAVNGQISVDHFPVLSAVSNQTVIVGSALTFTISASDSDGDTLTYSAFNLPSGASFNPSTCIFSWTPSPGQVGAYSNVQFQVTDGMAASYQNITITVSKATPVFISLSSPSINYGTTPTSLGGTIKLGSLIPTGNVSITLNGVTQNAAIDGSANFSSSFATGGLGTSGSPYTLSYVYNGDANFNNISDNSKKLTVTPPAAWDVNMDGATNVLDMISVSQYMGQSGSPGWIKQDVNADGVINVLDLIIIGQHWTG